MKQIRDSDPSSGYELIARAMAELRPMTCVYDGCVRAFCPIILGHTDGREKTLVCQFAGSTSAGALEAPDWKCFFVSEMRALEISEGPWQAGGLHRTGQTCVKVVDLDVNPSSPYNPKRRLHLLRTPSGRAKRTRPAAAVKPRKR